MGLSAEEWGLRDTRGLAERTASGAYLALAAAAAGPAAHPCSAGTLAPRPHLAAHTW